jgi:hypothetical protein
MKLSHGLHLAYCTNIHRGQSWAETWDGLKRYTLVVRDRVSPKSPYAIGLRLSDQASRELADPQQLLTFQKWLERENCYVFTINGFPYGQFHGTRVKEQVYAPDWTTTERLDYTCRLFELLEKLLPPGLEGSVSTVPCSYKEFIRNPDQDEAMRENLWKCIEHIAGKNLHLGLEPEPLCYLETSHETVEFLDRMRADRPGDDRLDRHLGVNYDTCHLAVEYEEPGEVLKRFKDHNVRISKLHLSSALRVQANAASRDALRAFADDTYFHQVIERMDDGKLKRYKDLDVALAHGGDNEWRIHFHVPLHSPPTKLFGNTADHLIGVLDALRKNPQLCSHLEMETYTWEVMPAEMKNRDVVEQLVGEYDWTLKHLAERGFTRAE